MSDFGPQLIGQTEKALNAVLAQELQPFGVSEPEWVVLRLATQRPMSVALDAYVRQQAQLADATALVQGLRTRGFLDGDMLCEQGEELVARVQASIRERTAHVWDGVDPVAAASAARALDQVRRECLRLIGEQ